MNVYITNRCDKKQTMSLNKTEHTRENALWHSDRLCSFFYSFSFSVRLSCPSWISKLTMYKITVSCWTIRKVGFVVSSSWRMNQRNQGFSHWVWISFVMLTLNILKMPSLPPSVLPCLHDTSSFFLLSVCFWLFVFKCSFYSFGTALEGRIIHVLKNYSFSDCSMVPSMEENWPNWQWYLPDFLWISPLVTVQIFLLGQRHIRKQPLTTNSDEGFRLSIPKDRLLSIQADT